MKRIKILTHQAGQTFQQFEEAINSACEAIERGKQEWRNDPGEQPGTILTINTYFKNDDAVCVIVYTRDKKV